jgi:putative MATE family efflux protein
MEHGVDLTKGPIGKQLWSLAWPMMLSVFFYTLYNLVDAYWVSKLSPEAIAAVSISQITLFLMISLGFGITIGSGVVMSMDIGAKNKKGAERVLGQSFVLMSIVAVFFTIIALIFRTQLLTVSGASGAIFDPALEYFTVTAGGSILFFILVTIMFAFNAQGDTFTLTKLFALSTLVNTVLDPILIFGWWGAPALGIAGAAYATLISQAVFIIVALYSLSRPQRSVQFHFRNLSFRWESVKKVMAIGIPAALTQVINPVGLAALTLVSSHAFQEAGAISMSLGFRIEFFAYLPAVGYGFASMAMMGQNIGAEKLDRAKEILRTAMKYASSVALGLGIVVAIFAPQIVAAFTTDPTVTEYSLLYMRVVSFSYFFLAAMMVEANAFQAMGKSWPGFWIMFLRFLVISLPLAYVLTVVFDFSIVAIWLSIVAGNVIASIVGYIWIWSLLNKFDFTEVEETVHA